MSRSQNLLGSPIWRLTEYANSFCTSPGNLIASTISQEQRVSPDAYHPNTELVTYCAGVPRPLQLGLELNINEC